KSLQSSVRFHPAFGVVFLLLYASFRLFISFAKPIHSVKLITTVDPDIVLVNIGDTDRAGIGKLLLAIDSSQPVLIAVDVLFFGSKGPVQDSVFSNALETTRNDILAYNLDSLGKPVEVQDQFRAFITDQGLMKFERVHYLVSRTKPVRVIDDDIYEDLALKIVKLWKPGFSHRIKKNMSIPIEFRRLLQSFMVFDGIDINDVDPEFLKNKIVLVGYIGPSDGDKFYTPIRLLKYYPPDVPDTYGLVILANEIRTILGYEVKD
ncbi:MAG TPA: CHASE2 domain-containing protein, partial [Chitinophagaceae bacterium]|nr:CHASE2 domain-containing protein [Chitinophagaceae bacterium]